MRRYHALFANPGPRRLLIGAALARYPLTMAPLALILIMHDHYGSYTAAGLVAGAHAFASATMTAPHALLTARFGNRRFLIGSAVCYVIAIAGLSSLIRSGAPLIAVTTIAALAGAALPVVGDIVRRALRAHAKNVHALPGDPDSLLVEAVSVTGPLLVAILASAGSPSFALSVTAIGAAIGAVLVAIDEHLVTDRDEPNARVSSARPMSVALILISVFGVLFGFGALDVGVVVFVGGGASAGVLLALWALGSVLGGQIWSAHGKANNPTLAYRWALIGMAVCHMPLLLAAKTVTLGLVLVLAGLSIAPVVALGAGLLQEAASVAPWMYAAVSAVGYAGMASGAIAAGIFADAGPSQPQQLFMLTAAAPVAAAALAALAHWILGYVLTPAGRHRYKQRHKQTI